MVALGGSTLPVKDRDEVLAFQMTVGELLRAVRGADGKVQEALGQLTQIKTAVNETPEADAGLLDEARALELKLMDVRVALTGDNTRTERGHTAELSIMRRVQNAHSGTLSNTYGPTETHRRDYEIGREQYEDVAGDLKKLIEADFMKLKQKLDKAGVPWTPGRSLPKIKPPSFKPPNGRDL